MKVVVVQNFKPALANVDLNFSTQHTFLLNCSGKHAAVGIIFGNTVGPLS
jgi:hypothetical protein